MSHAAPLPFAQVDMKRVFATSGAIALHVAVLMALLMPPEIKMAVEEDTITDVMIDPPKPIKPPDPPPIQPIKPQPVHQAPAPQIPIPDVQVEPVDAPPAPIDVIAPVVPDTANTFDTSPPQASAIQQLAIAVGAPPPYPSMAIRRGIEGTVMLRIHVDANGMPMEVLIESSSGSRILDEAAQKFVKAKWRFVPAQSNGQAVDAWGLVPVEYVLR